MACDNCNQTVLPTTIVSGPPGQNGQDGAPGIWGGMCVHYKFSASTTSTNPGTGLLNFNTSLLNLSTQMYISYVDDVGTDLTTFLDSLDVPNNAVKALIRVTSITDESLFVLYEVNDVTAGSGFVTYDLTYLDGNTNPFNAGDDILICPALSGDSTFNLMTLSPDFVTGINYPASTIGDVYRILTPGWVGTTAAVEPGGSIRVFKDDMLFCIANTAGGDQAAAGASFFVFSAPRAFVPDSTTNGDSNFILNTDSLTDNNISGSTNSVVIGNLNSIVNSHTNLVLGVGDTVSGNTLNTSNENLLSGQRLGLFTSNDNIVTGLLSVLVGSNNNIVGGTQNSVLGGDNNIATGFNNSLYASIQGDNNLISGTLNEIFGSSNLVTGENNEVITSVAATNLNSLVAGSGASNRIANGLVLGACNAPNSFVGKGSFQSMIFPLAGTLDNVISPTDTPMVISTNAFAAGVNLLTVPNNSIWYYDINLVVVQKTKGTRHTNTSAAGDTVGYEISGAVINNAGTLTMLYQKYTNERGQQVNVTPSINTDPYVRRFIKYNDGTQADLQIAKPSVMAAGTLLYIRMFFPGFQGVMPSSTVSEPAYGELAAGITLTGDGVTTGVIAAPAIGTSTYRNPAVDIYGGYQLQGGSGVGATATAQLTATTVANNAYICSGGTGYSNGNLVFSSGAATGTYTTTAGVITGVTITSGGSYTTVPTVTGFSNPGVNGNVTLYLTPTNVDNITIVDPGAGYTAVPNGVVYDAGSTQCGAGNGGSFVAGGTIKITQVKF